MRVKLKSAVILPTCEIAPAGVTLEVSEEVATGWCERGIAEMAPAPAPAPAPLPPPPPPPQQPKQPKEKR